MLGALGGIGSWRFEKSGCCEMHWMGAFGKKPPCGCLNRRQLVTEWWSFLHTLFWCVYKIHLRQVQEIWLNRMGGTATFIVSPKLIGFRYHGALQSFARANVLWCCFRSLHVMIRDMSYDTSSTDAHLRALVSHKSAMFYLQSCQWIARTSYICSKDCTKSMKRTRAGHLLSGFTLLMNVKW